MDFENDVPLNLAQAAHAGTSMVPEKRAEQMQAEYAQTMRADYATLEKYATTDEKRATLAAEFERFREGYRRRFCAWLTSRSRIVSSMIAGPSNFPARRMQKRNDVADRRIGEVFEFRKRALDAIRRALCPELAPIMSGDTDAADRLRAKIAAAEAAQERMKAVNLAHKHYLKDSATLAASGLGEAEQKLVREYKPAYSWEPHPYAPFELTNNGANIRRMQERLAQVEQAKATPETAAQGTAARLEDSPPDNRVRLFFPGKPEADVRETLKRGGFRWTPTMGCWQAYRNPGALALARKVAGVGPHPCGRCDRANEIVNQCGCDQNNLPTPVPQERAEA